MALNHISLPMIEPYLGGAVLSLGYPSFGRMDGKIEDLIAAKGGTFSCVDIFRHQGFEILCDLNQPAHFPAEYDLVIDPGTLEHCFNIGQAMINAASAVKVGGRIFHGSPLTMLNHGFYNLSPTLFQHFYEANGFVVDLLEGHGDAGKGAKVPIRLHWRFAGEVNSAFYCMARRIEKVMFRYPIQKKYIQARKEGAND
ncbi:MAG: hypothetical protein NUV51_03785 [Sulfuricaulis sp.]|nr:hypothetical protein [Sulfuricaulis sp.]